MRIDPAAPEAAAAFRAEAPGEYEVEIRWLDTSNALLKTERRIYRLDTSLAEDAALLRNFLEEMAALKKQAPRLSGLLDHFSTAARAAFEQARASGRFERFEALRAEREYQLALALHCARASAESFIMVHPIRNPWIDFDAAAFFRAGAAPPDSLTLAMLGGEHESAALAVTNLRPRPAALRLECGSFRSAAGGAVEAKEVVQFREVPLVLPNITGRPSEDPLPLLGEGGLIRLGAGETLKLWLTFRSHTLAAGDHRAALRLGEPASLEPPVEFPLALKVHAARLPEKFVYRHSNWLYLAPIADEALREATLRDALEHGTNVFVIPAVTVRVRADGELTPAETEPHDALVRKLRGRAFLLIGGSVSLTWPSGPPPDPRAEEKAYAGALRWYARHMESLGCGYGDYALYLQDEPGLCGPDAAFDRYVEQVKRVKAADPRLQIYANPAGGARAELLRPLADLIDVWAPDLHLVREQPEELAEIFRRGKQYWHYEAPADQRNLDPLGFYRMKPWVAFQLGMTGGGYWVYAQDDYWLPDPRRGSEYGTVYPGERGPVTTRRWEASRDGIEDFELLWMLREKAQRQPSPAADAGLKLIAEAVAFVTRGQEKVSDISRQVEAYTPDFEAWMAYRDQLIQALLRLPP